MKLFLQAEVGLAAPAEKVLSVGHGRFAGQNADVIQLLRNDGKAVSQGEYFVALAPNDRSIDLAAAFALLRPVAQI